MKRLLTTLAAAIGLAASTFAATIDLSTVTANTTIPDSTTLTGTLYGNITLTIATGATVTLSGVSIYSSSGAGLQCESATIILADGTSSTVEGSGDYPGIYVRQGGGLTIRGSGSLTVRSNGNGAGIGGGYNNSCGAITINGGTITATGGQNAAGIGSGSMARCGNIAITGGTVKSSGGYGAAGIGCGLGSQCGGIAITGGTVESSGGDKAAGIGGGLGNAGGGGGAGASAGCGNITITKDVARVTAIKGNDAPNSIGAGYNSNCGTVTIGGVVGAITESPYTFYGEDIDLSALSGDIIVSDGRTLTGTLGGNYKVSIADGATVTLRNATIDGVNNSSYKWAGITCVGNATIILEGANTVKGFYDEYPGIYVPVGSTLIIKGDGSLDASSNNWGAGIGGGYACDCGNIVVRGGNITAMCVHGAAGIGGGYNKTCGDIYIEGGTVNATGGNNGAAGIGGGGGSKASCGNITITKGVTSVTATKDEGSTNSIGNGNTGICGTVTIGGVVTGPITESPYTYPDPSDIVDLSSLTGSYTAKDGEFLRGTTTYPLTIPGGATVVVNGVSITGAGGGAANPAPAFAADGKAATTEFVKGAGGKWTLTTFAELDNDALGKDIADGQIKVYAADTLEGLKTASPLSSGVTLKEKKSAVKTTLEVTPPDLSAPAQFFQVKFGE